MSSSVASALAEPFDAYVTRRARSTVALAPGEAVTATVGLLRGCRGETGRPTGTSWWLTASGCPVAVDDPTGPDAVAATAESLARLAAIASDEPTREIVDRARESVLTRPPRDWDAVERRLFSHADPVPLVLGPLTPAVDEAPEPLPLERSGAVDRVLELVDADLAGATRTVLNGLRERWRTSRAVRLSTFGVGAVAIAVIAVALAPAHTTSTPSATTVTAAVTDPEPTSMTPWLTEPPAVDPRKPLSDDMVEVARALFTEIGGCQGETSCTSSFEEDSAFPREPLIDAAEGAEITVVDDFGGVAVVRVSAGETTQYVTLVRQTERWLVRAVRTVTDQPS